MERKAGRSSVHARSSFPSPFGSRVWHSDFDLSTRKSKSKWTRRLSAKVVLLISAVVMSPVVFGLPHVLAWNAIFPRYAELILWRTSTVAVMWTGALEVILFWSGLLLQLHLHANVVAPMVGLLPRIPLLIHAIASTYLTVQSVRQFFFLPDDVFKVPSFSNYLPHLS